MQIKVLIIEDEAPAARRLKKLLEEINQDIVVLDEKDSVEGAVEWIQNNPAPDLFLMDVQLSDGISFDIFNKVEVPAPVIFTTAYDEYALKAFKVNSVDYLLKPVNSEELEAAINKFITASSQGDINSPLAQAAQIEQVLETMNIKPKAFKSRFLIKIGDKYISVPTEQIAYFYTEDKGVYLVTKDEKHRYPVDHSLDEIDKLLDPDIFFRLNRQYIACIDNIVKFHTYFNGKLKVFLDPEPGHEVVVSREKASIFKSWLDR
jgi:two-component system LytT family response regulator